MEPEALKDITAILQAAISPVALLSGVGLLLLSLTNRWGRVADRARALSEQRHTAAPEEIDNLDTQTRILYRRARILRASISLAAASILFASLLIVALFLAYLFQVSVRFWLIGLFAVSFAALIPSILLLMQDAGMSLRALRLELDAHHARGAHGPPDGSP
ncbi:MAG: DUF2721 domain-containing protein [Nitrospirae bacterium]|nr:DUF2721 domain-containing protein [Nitrospirota bacterium]